MFACGSELETMLLKKTIFSIRQRGFHPCFCLPACCNCPVALSEFVTYFIKIINCELASFKKCNCIRKKLAAKYNLLRKCGLLAHTSAAFLKNCCTEKLFGCLRLEPTANLYFFFLGVIIAPPGKKRSRREKTCFFYRHYGMILIETSVQKTKIKTGG